MTSDEWLANNAFERRHLAARFTVDQCKANQQRAMHVQFPGLLAPCIACGGEDRMAKNKVIEQKTKRPYNRKAKPVEVAPRQVPVVDGQPQEFIDHSAPITQQDLERAADDYIAQSISDEASKPEMRSLLYFLSDVQPPPPPAARLLFRLHRPRASARPRASTFRRYQLRHARLAHVPPGRRALPACVSR